MPKKGASSKASKSGMFGPSPSAVRSLPRRQGKEGVPPTQLSTLVFPVAFTSSSGTGGAWYWQWRINSLYDPDFTGGGVQPTTFDQWMTLYDRYRVLSVEVDLTITDLTQGTGLAVVGAPGSDAVPTLTYSGLCGMRGAARGKETGSYLAARRVKQLISIKDVVGVDQESLYSEINLSGTSSTSAPEVAYYSVGAFQSGGGAFSVMVDGEIRFGVRFESPNSNNVSLTRRAPLPLPPVRAVEGQWKTWSVSQAAPVTVSDLTREQLEDRVRQFLASKDATQRESQGSLLQAATPRLPGSVAPRLQAP